MYSQNKEEEIILYFFKDESGCLLDIGANDGKTFSNSLAIIEKKWNAVLVEPSPKAFLKLKELHAGNANVILHQVAITDKDGEITLYESGSHINENDIALLSTTKREEMQRWHKETFTPVKVNGLSFNTFLSTCRSQEFQLILVDTEGCEIEILKQIDFDALKTKMVVAEWNGKRRNEFDSIMQPFGFKNIHFNSENLIYSR